MTQSGGTHLLYFAEHLVKLYRALIGIPHRIESFPHIATPTSCEVGALL